MGVVIFILTLFGAIFGIWRYVEAKIAKVQEEADRSSEAARAMAVLARDEIYNHRIHTAETYATKAGMQEQTAQIMRAIEAVAARIEGLYERFDRWQDSSRKP